MTREEVRYYSRIRINAEHSVDQLILNGSAVHAVQLMTTMFNFAQRSILLFTGSLMACKPPAKGGQAATPIYADEGLVKSATAFLGKKKTEFRVITEEPVKGMAYHPLITAIKALAASKGMKGSFSIATLNSGYRDKNPLKGHHFMLMDDRGYRLEVSHENAEAYANFNDKKDCGLLRRVFLEKFTPNSQCIESL